MRKRTIDELFHSEQQLMIGYCGWHAKKTPKLTKLAKEIKSIESDCIKVVFDEWLRMTRLVFEIRKIMHYYLTINFDAHEQNYPECFTALRQTLWKDE